MHFVLVIFLLLITPLQAHAKEGSIAVLLKGMSNPYWSALNNGIQEAAKENNLTIYVQGVQSDSAAEEQLNLCNTMLLHNPKALIFAAVNDTNLTPCLKKANEQGIVLVDVDGGTGKETAEKMGINLRFSVASNNYELGKKAATYLQSHKGKVLLIEGFPGSVAGLARVEGFKQNLPDNMELIASLPGDWDRLKAANIAQDIITKHPDLSTIFAANDLMALGASEALITAGKTDVIVIGVDGIKDAVKAIKNDRLTATIAQLPYLMGQEALLKTDKYLKGEEQYEFDQHVPIVTLTKDVLDKNEEPLLQYVR